VSQNPAAGLFVGLVTLDLIYLADHAPCNNQKLVARDYTVAAGGPATNAAVAFGALGGKAIVLGAVGRHALARLIQTELRDCEVEVVDLAPDRLDAPPVSSIVVTQSTGERAVISINAVKAQADASAIPQDLQAVAIVLIDGHQMSVGREIAARFKADRIPVVIDGGSWKPGFETVLPLADYAICSANFRPPHCQDETEVIPYLTGLGISHIAITHGADPIMYHSKGHTGTISVPQVQAIDTLGAGDIFHGAFCHHILQTSFPEALQQAATIAAQSCQFFGPRHWINEHGTGTLNA